MTKKDFELIAATIRGLDLPDNTRATVARAFAFASRETNPRFDVPRFMRACLGDAYQPLKG